MTQQPPKLPPGFAGASLAGLDNRSAAILRELVETYVATGEPVGSRTLSRRLPLDLSPASIRNVIADLEEAGFLYAPHTSAGRLPTERGLRLFVDGLLEFGDLAEGERAEIAARCAASGRSLEETRAQVQSEIAANRTALDTLTNQVIAAGLATWAGGGAGSLIVLGQAR